LGKTYFWEKQKIVTINFNKIDLLGGQVEEEALLWYQFARSPLRYPIDGILECSMKKPSVNAWGVQKMLKETSRVY
jgi:hypothetical protein